MGLDITAYRRLTPVGKVDASIEEQEIKFYINPDFPQQADGIDAKVLYSAEQKFSFGAGSYDGWREELARIAGYPATSYEIFGSTQVSHAAYVWGSDSRKGMPFEELIDFSDCEGTIGPITSAKLANDFGNFKSKVSQWKTPYFGFDHLGFSKHYHKWHKAFLMAADNGAVSFH